MKKLSILLLVLLLSSVSTIAQKKSELHAEIVNLKKERDAIKGQVSDAELKERLSTAKAEALQTQVNDLQEANETLLKNLNTFTTASNKNSESINIAMQNLKSLELQLSSVREAIASNDSTAIVVLTGAKKSLGENANISINNSALIISEKLDVLFEDGNNTTLKAASEPWLEKVAAIVKANPNLDVTIEGLSMTGELEVAGQQALAIGTLFQEKFEISGDRIATIGKDGNLKEGILIKIHPRYADFYKMVKDDLK